jgi:hypothetical protein
MADLKCPECGSTVAPSDSHCMDCGVDLAIARTKKQEELRASSIAGTRTGPPSPVVATANPAAAGIHLGGDTSEETRLKYFDKEAAKRMKSEIGVTIFTALLGIAIGAALVAIGFKDLKEAGGMEALKTVSLKSMRMGSGFPEGLTGILLLGNGLGALLCGVGQVVHFLGQRKAIKQVERGEKPDVVVMCEVTHVGMLGLAIFCPPFGLIVGILLKLSKDGDMKMLGGQMLLFSAVVLGLFVGNMVWGFAEAAMPKPAPVKK